MRLTCGCVFHEEPYTITHHPDCSYHRDERVLHCWTDYQSTTEYGSEAWAEAFNRNATCMLPRHHPGPHWFTPDDEIKVSFA